MTNEVLLKFKTALASQQKKLINHHQNNSYEQREIYSKPRQISLLAKLHISFFLSFSFLLFSYSSGLAEKMYSRISNYKTETRASIWNKFFMWEKRRKNLIMLFVNIKHLFFVTLFILFFCNIYIIIKFL